LVDPIEVADPAVREDVRSFSAAMGRRAGRRVAAPSRGVASGADDATGRLVGRRRRSRTSMDALNPIAS
jgi:hypothetical protein